MQFRRRPGRPVCSPAPARPYTFVSGSKFFTQLPAGKCDFACGPAGRFAPRSSLSLIPSFRGANSSHNFRPKSAVSPAIGPAGIFCVRSFGAGSKKAVCNVSVNIAHCFPIILFIRNRHPQMLGPADSLRPTYASKEIAGSPTVKLSIRRVVPMRTAIALSLIHI